jgi:hypothetical protein
MSLVKDATLSDPKTGVAERTILHCYEAGCWLLFNPNLRCDLLELSDPVCHVSSGCEMFEVTFYYGVLW